MEMNSANRIIAILIAIIFIIKIAKPEKGSDYYLFDIESNAIVANGSSSQEGQTTRTPILKNVTKKSHDEPASKLLHDVIETYRKEIIPERPVYVKLDLLLMKVKNTVEKEGIFESVIALFMHWHDKRMAWDPTVYSNITALTFHPNRLWMPDIALINSADNQYTITKDYRFLARLSFDGCVKFVPTAPARTWCKLRLVTFPFDTQTCSFEFESWSMDSTIFRFNETSEAQVDETVSSPQWKICHRNATVYNFTYILGGSIDTFSRIRFEYVVRRKSTFYIVNLIFPCATISMTQLVVFTIPAQNTLSNRIGFGTVNVLTLVVFQTIISRQLPKSSDAISALSDYIIALILSSAVGIFQSVLIQRALRKTKPPPSWAVTLLKYVPLLWAPPTPARPQRKKKKVKLIIDKDGHRHRHECKGIIASPLPVISHEPYAFKFIGKGTVHPIDAIQNHHQNQKMTSREKWEELATRFDCLVFLVSVLIALIMPGLLFLPVIINDNKLCPSDV